MAPRLLDQELSLYYVANDIAQTYHGMMIAIPEDEWRVSAVCVRGDGRHAAELAQQVASRPIAKVLGGEEAPAETRGTTKASLSPPPNYSGAQIKGGATP